MKFPNQADRGFDPAGELASLGGISTPAFGQPFGSQAGLAAPPLAAPFGAPDQRQPDKPATPQGVPRLVARGKAEPIQLSAADLQTLVIATISGAKRSESVEKLAHALAAAVPGTSVRCAIGSQGLRRFYDARLGWLGPESALHRELGSRWDSLTGESAESCLVESQLLILLRRPNWPDCGLIWIAGEAVSDGLLKQLDAWAPLIAASLWSRPTRSLLKPLERSWAHRWWIATIATLVLALLFMPVRYRAACAVKVEPLRPRIVSAPFEATIQEVLVHPGDQVSRGQTLLRLDGRPLRLELQSLEAEIQHVVKQKDIALATGRVAESQQAQLRYQQLVRQRDLIDRRLKQLEIISPIAGIVVSGDLRRAVGSALELGRVLMEIAPLDRVLIEIEVPEYEISMVDQRSPARIRIDASRAPTVDCELVEIYPAGELRNEQMVFIAPLEIDNAEGVFRPGMTGKATVYGDYRPLIWPYIRKAIDQTTWLAGL